MLKLVLLHFQHSCLFVPSNTLLLTVSKLQSSEFLDQSLPSLLYLATSSAHQSWLALHSPIPRISSLIPSSVWLGTFLLHPYLLPV